MLTREMNSCLFVTGRVESMAKSSDLKNTLSEEENMKKNSMISKVRKKDA